MGKHCCCSHVRSPVKHVITSIASLSFFGLNVDKWSLVCWSVTLAGIQGDSLVGSHTSALADTPPALWIAGWARLWVCSWGRSQSHSGFGQDESLYVLYVLWSTFVLLGPSELPETNLSCRSMRQEPACIFRTGCVRTAQPPSRKPVGHGGSPGNGII